MFPRKSALLLFFSILITGLYAQQDSILRIKIKGLSIAYQKRGTGSALVLLHGFTQDSRAWKKQMDELSKNFTVIAWDAPGAGLSDDPAGNYKMSDWADCLAILMDSLHIKQAHVLGISWGGVLAQEFYRRHPKKVLSLILADTNPGWSAISDSVAKARLDACVKDIALTREEFVQKYLPGMFSSSVNEETKKELSKIIAETHNDGFLFMTSAIAESDMRKLLPVIKVPVLLLWGEKDQRAPVSIAAQMHSLIPDSKLEIIAGCGHISNMEQPEKFNGIVKEFCLSLEKEK